MTTITVDDITVFTNLLDGGRYYRCSCGHHMRLTDRKYCYNCGRYKTSFTEVSKEDWKAYREDVVST